MNGVRVAWSMVQRPRGTRDFTPQVMARRLAFEQLLEERSRRHGFKRVQTPVFESLDLFTAKSGPGVISQLYAFEDKGGRPLTLRPELTAPVMRMIAEEMRNDTKPLRLSYYGQCYRYEEFKKGRYREFFQYGVELIGASGPLAEAEVIALAIDMLDACGLTDWEIRIGHVGILKGALTDWGFPRRFPKALANHQLQVRCVCSTRVMIRSLQHCLRLTASTQSTPHLFVPWPI